LILGDIIGGILNNVVVVYWTIKSLHFGRKNIEVVGTELIS
jgi:hypothetical protein